MLTRNRKLKTPTRKYSERYAHHVTLRHPETGVPYHHTFATKEMEKEDVEIAWQQFLKARRKGTTPSPVPQRKTKVNPALRKGDDILPGTARPPRKKRPVLTGSSLEPVEANIVPGSLLHITSGFLAFEESR